MHDFEANDDVRLPAAGRGGTVNPADRQDEGRRAHRPSARAQREEARDGGARGIPPQPGAWLTGLRRRALRRACPATAGARGETPARQCRRRGAIDGSAG